MKKAKHGTRVKISARVDRGLIFVAKKYSFNHNISLSHLIEQLLVEKFSKKTVQVTKRDSKNTSIINL